MHNCCIGLFVIHYSKLKITCASDTKMKKDKEVCCKFYTIESMTTRDCTKPNNSFSLPNNSCACKL